MFRYKKTTFGIRLSPKRSIRLKSNRQLLNCVNRRKKSSLSRCFSSIRFKREREYYAKFKYMSNMILKICFCFHDNIKICASHYTPLTNRIEVCTVSYDRVFFSDRIYVASRRYMTNSNTYQVCLSHSPAECWYLWLPSQQTSRWWKPRQTDIRDRFHIELQLSVLNCHYATWCYQQT